ncbi:TonB-dependent receptor [Mesorhizobium loti]|nr:TonB-dependent receptor [Mesorhizobium loti]
MQVSITLDDCDIRAPGANDGQMTRGHIRELVEQRLLVRRNEFRVLQIVPGYFQAAAPVGEPVLTRQQDGLDLPLVEGEGTFVFPDEDALASLLLSGMAPCEASTHASIFPSFLVSTSSWSGHE